MRRRAASGVIRGPDATGFAWSHIWRALLCAALLVQCVFVQSHVHAAAPVARTAAAELQMPGQPANLSSDSTSNAVEYCLQCWEAAMAGHYVQPSAGFALPPAPVMLWGTVAALTEWLLRQPPRAWLGRAPPQ